MSRILTTIIHNGRKEGLVCQSIRIAVKIVVFNSTANSILTILCLSAALSVTRISCEKCSCRLGSYLRVAASIRPIIALRLDGPARENRETKKPSPRANPNRNQKNLPRRVTLIEGRNTQLNRKSPGFDQGFLLRMVPD